MCNYITLPNNMKEKSSVMSLHKIECLLKGGQQEIDPYHDYIESL